MANVAIILNNNQHTAVINRFLLTLPFRKLILVNIVIRKLRNKNAHQRHFNSKFQKHK